MNLTNAEIGNLIDALGIAIDGCELRIRERRKLRAFVGIRRVNKRDNIDLDEWRNQIKWFTVLRKKLLRIEKENLAVFAKEHPRREQ